MTTTQSTEVLHAVGIDVETRHAPLLRRVLRRWKAVHRVEDGGQYREDRSYSRVHIWTTLPIAEVERRLDTLNHVDHVGVFARTDT